MSGIGHLRSFSVVPTSEVMISPDVTSGKIIKSAQMPYSAQIRRKRE
jgi:hypothetical protein